MKRKLLLKLAIISTLLMFLTTNLFAQNADNTTQDLTLGLPAVHLIYAVDSSATHQAIDLSLTTNRAGTKITGGSGTSYLQVSCIVATSGATNTVNATVTGLPSGTTLDVTTTAPTITTDADGTYGTGLGPVTLSGTAADIITGIGSCYTGTGHGEGYVLKWQWNAGGTGVSYSDIVATGSTTATVTMTITSL